MPLSRDTISQMFIENYDFIRSVAYRNAPSKHLQDDIVHDVYIEFVENSYKWTIGPEGPRPLLRTLAKNISLQYWRKFKKGLPESVRQLAETIWRDADSEKMLEEQNQLHQQLEALELCLDKLTPENKKIIELCYFEKKTYKELAKSRNRTTAALYTLISRIRSFLHNCVSHALEMEADDV